MTDALTKKVLLLGWDAADWKVITPLMDEGKMPNLERLVSQGVMGNLATLYPVLSPMLWTSIATGKRGFKHGIHGFSEPDPSTGGVRPITNLGRKTKAIWNILNQEGLKSNVVSWWPSRPVEPINGVMVSDLYHKAPKKPLGEDWPLPKMDVHPERLIEPLAKYRVHPHELTAEALLPFVPNAAKIDQKNDKRLMSVAKILAECVTVQAAATAIMQLEEWDFMGVYFDAIDHFCHGFMKYHPPRQDWVSEEDFDLYKDVVNGAYLFHDMMLGAMMELVDDETTIIIVSDHGFHPDHLRPKQLPNEPAGPAEEHRHFGMFAAMGPGIKKDELVFGANLLDITPTILALMGKPIGRDMDGKPLVTAFDRPIDVKFIDSWDEVKGDDGSHPADQKIDPVDNHQAMKQLVELGYIDSPDEDQSVAVAQTIRELRHNLARDYMDAHQHFKAMSIYKELWQEWPDESRFGVKLFDCQLAVEHLQDAEQTLEKIVSSKQRYAKEAQEELIKLNQDWQDRDEDSIEDYERNKMHKLTMRANFNEATFHFMQGRLYFAQERHADAMIALRKAEVAELHNLPSLYEVQGNVLLQMHRYEEAEKRFNKILEIDPISAHAHSGLCRTYLGMRKNKDALVEAQASLGLLYFQPQIYLYQGVCLHRLGRVNEAIASIKTALSQNPIFPAAHKRLAQIYDKRLKDPILAEKHRQQAKQCRQQLRDFKLGKTSGNQFEANEKNKLTEAVSLGILGKAKKLPALADDEVLIVSGLPRSGTSMMMQILEAGGIPLLSDDVRKADDNNPKGYYELEQVKGLQKDNSCLAEAKGKGVKVIAQLLPYLDKKVRYRIIFMERHLQEILASQTNMLDKQADATEQNKIGQAYAKQVMAVRDLLAKYPDQIQLLSVPYEQALSNPQLIIPVLCDFIGKDLNQTAMAACVDKSLYRQRQQG